MKRVGIVITPCPSEKEIHNAVEVLSNQWLHVYQLLFDAGFTSPYNDRSLTVERSVISGHLTSHIRIFSTKNPKELYFATDGTDDELTLRKAELLVNGASKNKIDRRACCAYAVKRPCVCEVSFDCELHGTSHFGTHD